MATSPDHLFPYESLDKYTESLVQCPICHYYIKINPQTDSMKYKLLSKEVIHFLTFHQFNTSIHSLVIEYTGFIFTKIIDFSDFSDQHKESNLFPLFHLVDLSEYSTFRDRVLELESTNNQLIASFKSKLDSLEASYKQTELDNTTLRKQVSDLDSLRLDFESCLSDKMLELDSINDSHANASDQNFLSSDVKRDFIRQINVLEHDKFLLEQKLANQSTTESTTQFSSPESSNAGNKRPDPKILELLDIERHQKREAVREKKIFEFKVRDLQTELSTLKDQSSNKESIDQAIHELTLSYENKISELTLALQDAQDQVKLIQKSMQIESATTSTKKSSDTSFNKVYREGIAALFLNVQKTFNRIQYNLLLDFYHTEHFSGQLRNAFDTFFTLLIHRAQEIGRILLKDSEFLLFKDLRYLNPRLKFSQEQQEAAMHLQALHFTITEVLKYIFYIIRAIKADRENQEYVIIPDDVTVLTLVKVLTLDHKISFHIPLTDHTHFSNVGQSMRVWRPISGLYRDSFILITPLNDIALYNNSYQLIPFTTQATDSEVVIEIDNFFSENSVFQLGAFFDYQFFVIQSIDFKSDIASIKKQIQHCILQKEIPFTKELTFYL